MGKTTDGSLHRIEADYEKRIKRYTPFESIVIDNAAIKGPEAAVRQKEGEMILKRIAPADHLVLLDERGKTFTSAQWSQEINNWMTSSKKSVILTIGGPYGFSDDVKKRANSLVSLSAMTFSHQIVRIILMEQVYRAFTILNNEPYHHA